MAEGIVFDADAVSKDIAEGIAAIQQASTMEELKAIKAKYAGANSAMTRASKAIGSLAKNEKKEAGKVMGLWHEGGQREGGPGGCRAGR